MLLLQSTRSEQSRNVVGNLPSRLRPPQLEFYSRSNSVTMNGSRRRQSGSPHGKGLRHCRELVPRGIPARRQAKHVHGHMSLASVYWVRQKYTLSFEANTSHNAEATERLTFGGRNWADRRWFDKRTVGNLSDWPGFRMLLSIFS